TQTTNVHGNASVGSWTLGSTAGTNTLRARLIVGGVTKDSVLFTATGVTITNPTSFSRTDCYQDIGASPPDTMASYQLSWTNGSGNTGWELVELSTNDTTGSMPVLLSGSSGSSTWTPGHLTGTGGVRYYFLRNLFGSGHSAWL